MKFFIILNDETNNIKVYVSEDGKLHFVDKDGADTVLNFNSGVKELTFTISGEGNCPNYLDGTWITYINFRIGNFYDCGFSYCKIVFTAMTITQGRIGVRLNGKDTKISSRNLLTLEDNLQSGDYIAGSVAQQRICSFTAQITMT